LAPQFERSSLVVVFWRKPSWCCDATTTADGNAVTDEDLWKRIEAGKPVVFLFPQVREFEDLDQPIRALFKDDTILLVGSTKPLPGSNSPK
jgi:hypothetical protein